MTPAQHPEPPKSKLWWITAFVAIGASGVVWDAAYRARNWVLVTALWVALVTYVVVSYRSFAKRERQRRMSQPAETVPPNHAGTVSAAQDLGPPRAGMRLGLRWFAFMVVLLAGVGVTAGLGGLAGFLVYAVVMFVIFTACDRRRHRSPRAARQGG
ncbi:hypothetical protein [Candidatus Poriferisodalis sp.]|uniref:hypothetical protein n=1 Tax=Candidatus Poriferisodalis sp. TaxID=3101277 RepID=UPI003B0106DC